MSHNNPAKGVAPILQKMPLRKSLPTRLTSEKTGSSNSAAGPTSSKPIHGEKKTSLSSSTKKDTNLSNDTKEEKIEKIAANDENGASSSETNVALPQNVVPSDEPNEAESYVNGDIVVEENPQLTLSQGPVTTVH